MEGVGNGYRYDNRRFRVSLFFGLNQSSEVEFPPAMNTLLLEDNFMGNDGTAIVGHPPDVWNGPGANTWSSSGDMSLLNNKLNSGSHDSRAWKDYGTGNVRIISEMNMISDGEPSIALRRSDAFNRFLAVQELGTNMLRLYKQEAGSYALVGETARAFGFGVLTIEVIAYEDFIRVTSGAATFDVNGITFNQTATNHGLRSGGSNGGEFEYIRVYTQ